MGVQTKRRLSVSLSTEVADRLDRVVSLLPGATRSGVLDEMLAVTLPEMEDLVQLLTSARDESGRWDEAAARDHLASWVGVRVLRMTAPDGDGGRPG